MIGIGCTLCSVYCIIHNITTILAKCRNAIYNRETVNLYRIYSDIDIVTESYWSYWTRLQWKEKWACIWPYIHYTGMWCICCMSKGRQKQVYLCCGWVADECVSKLLFCAAKDGTRGAVVSAAGCAVWTCAVWESVWPLSDVEEMPSRVSVRCFALSAWTACVNVWEVEFTQTKAERRSYVFNILHNLLWLVTPCLVASKPSSQALLVPAVLVAVTDWLGVMWVGWLEALCVAGRRWAGWRGTSISSPRLACQRSCLLSSMVRHSLLSALPLWSLSDLTYHEIQSVPATAQTQLRSVIFDSFVFLQISH